MNWISALRNLDRRIIFLLMFIGVSIPLIKPLGFPVVPTQAARNIYDFIEKLQPGDVIVLSFDFDPASRAEVYPMAEAIIHHAFKKGLKIICPSLWPQGPSLATEAFNRIAPRYGKKYGEDWVNLGYLPGGTAGVIQIETMGASLRKAFPTDVRGTKLDEIPLMKNIDNFDPVKCIISLSSGDPGIPGWVQIARDRFGKPVAGGGTAVQAPQFFPFIQSGQLFGFLGGLKGAAEYEALVGEKGLGTSGMDAQSIAHLIIIIFIVLSNVFYFTEQRAMKKGGF